MPEQQWVKINGRQELLPDDSRRLIDWLRNDLGLTGTKEPCGHADCGGCSVLLDGKVVLSCCILAATVAGRQLITIEGLAETDPADSLLDAFVRYGALQCGYCTSGMIIAARAFLNSLSKTDSDTSLIDEQMVRIALAGNICRCTGYVQIIQAILAVAQENGFHKQNLNEPTWRLLSENVEK